MTWLNDDERETAIRAFRAAGYRQSVGKLVDKLEAMGVLHGGGSYGDGVTPCVHVRPGGTTSTEGCEEVHSLDSGLQVLLRHDREILEPHRAAKTHAEYVQEQGIARIQELDGSYSDAKFAAALRAKGIDIRGL